MATPETRRQLLVAVQACEDKKGEDTRILELDPVDSGLADFFLITSASNDRQVVAIADEIEYRLKKDFGLYATSVEGRRQAEWILLDYVDIVIHVFLAEKRAFYDIERLRKSARPLTTPEIESEIAAERKPKRAAKSTSKIAAQIETERKPALAKALAEKTRAVRSRTPAKTAKLIAKKAAKKVVAKAATAKPSAAQPSKTSPAKKSPSKSPKGELTVPTKKAAKKAVKKAATKAAKPTPKKTAAKPPVKKSPAKKAPAKKAAAKKTAAKKSAVPSIKAAAAPRQVRAIMPPPQGAKPPVIK